MMSCNTYTPTLLQNLNTFGANFERDDIIAIYYHAGYTVGEIIVTRHGIAIGERQVHRILREKQLKRRENQSSLEEIVRAILHELAGSSRNMGYRLIYRYHRVLGNCSLGTVYIGCRGGACKKSQMSASTSLF